MLLSSVSGSAPVGGAFKKQGLRDLVFYGSLRVSGARVLMPQLKIQNRSVQFCMVWVAARIRACGLRLRSSNMRREQLRVGGPGRRGATCRRQICKSTLEASH